MSKINNLNKINSLLHSPVITSRFAKQFGISSRMLNYFHKKGIIEKIGRGIYKPINFKSNIDFRWENLFLTAYSIPNGIICLISALCYYELTDEIMREIWIAVPNNITAPKRENTRIIRMRNTKLGQKTIKVDSFKVKIFDKERTVVDSFRFLDKETAIKSLKFYLTHTKNHKPNINKLLKYAKKLRVDLNPYIWTLTT